VHFKNIASEVAIAAVCCEKMKVHNTVRKKEFAFLISPLH